MVVNPKFQDRDGHGVSPLMVGVDKAWNPGSYRRGVRRYGGEPKFVPVGGQWDGGEPTLFSLSFSVRWSEPRFFSLTGQWDGGEPTLFSLSFSVRWSEPRFFSLTGQWDGGEPKFVPVSFYTRAPLTLLKGYSAVVHFFIPPGSKGTPSTVSCRLCFWIPF